MIAPVMVTGTALETPQICRGFEGVRDRRGPVPRGTVANVDRPSAVPAPLACLWAGAEVVKLPRGGRVVRPKTRGVAT